MYQDLSLFRLPTGFRGRSAFYVQLWWIVQATAFRWSPQFAYGWRRFLLRVFGAQIGRNVVIRPSATTTYPWKLRIGDYSWIGDNVILYTLGFITIGEHTVVSQGSHICAADHDSRDRTFAIRSRPIVIGSQVWIASDVFVAPGVSIGDAAVVGARSTVFRNLPPHMICFGHPCVAVRPRTQLQSPHY
jgi:putative colanic acid biosynthesis acetyltransferase WcaF